MPGKAKPYEQFGPYILFKKLEADALGELWRAARIEGDHLGPLLALRRLTGGHRTALLQSVADARSIVPLLNGTSFVKNQTVDVIDAIPFIAFDYAGGRSLRYIVDRARGGTGATPNPVPLDQAVLIASRVALSLATTADMRYGNERLTHGALIPQFVWVTDDGEVRVAGQQLGKGMVASLQETAVNADIGRYFSPEYRTSGTPTKASEVYSMGAVLYLLVTGAEPPDSLHVTAFTQTVRAAKAMAGQPIPLDVRSVLDKSLILDPASRYGSVADMKQALDTAAAKYSATTFNLAFYLSTLLKKEMEAETIDREKESNVNLAAYTSLAASSPAAPKGEAEPPKRTGLIAAIAAVVVLALGGAAFMFVRKPAPAPAPVSQRAAVAPAPKPAPVLPPPVIASTVAPDPNAAKKAFEQAVNQKLQQEMLKLQSEFNKQQKKEKPAPAATRQPVTTVAEARPAPPPVEEHAPSAAALDERRLASRQEVAPPPTATVPDVVQPQPVVTQTTPPAVPAPTPAPVQPTVREGDLIEIADLDTLPHLIRQPVVAYPPVAVRERIQTTVILTALVSESGEVIDVRVLRGDARFGFSDAAIRAMRTARFSPPMKDGKRVKTWFPQTINFKL